MNEPSNVLEALLLEGFLDDPDVMGAPTRAEALRIIREKRLGLWVSQTRHEQFKLIPGEVADVLPTIPEESFDFIISDIDRTLAYKGFLSIDPVLLRQFALECFRILRPGGSVVFFVSARRAQNTIEAFRGIGFDAYPRPCVWVHGSPWADPNEAIGLMQAYSPFVVFSKGRPTLLRPMPDVVQDTYAVLEGNKPTSLYEKLLKTFVASGGDVFDPFPETGPTFEAAALCLCNCTGVGDFPEIQRRINRLKGIE